MVALHGWIGAQIRIKAVAPAKEFRLGVTDTAEEVPPGQRAISGFKLDAFAGCGTGVADEKLATAKGDLLVHLEVFPINIKERQGRFQLLVAPVHLVSTFILQA